MSTENPPFTLYQAVVDEAQRHTYTGLVGKLLTTDATLQLVLTTLTAFESGLSREEIVTALIEGEARGVTLYRSMLSVPDVTYWQAVREEAERFWVDRSQSS